MDGRVLFVLEDDIQKKVDKLHGFFYCLTSKDRHSVLIIDDSTYDRSRSKVVELPCPVKDHFTDRYIQIRDPDHAIVLRSLRVQGERY